MKNKLSICLWFDSEAEQAAKFYTSIFQDGKIGKIARFAGVGQEIHGKPEGSVMTVNFTLNGMDFIALNGGPDFKFNESISICVYCEVQEEIDYFWDKLTEGGEESYCGWLKDKYGVSWQIIPSVLEEMLSDSDLAKVQKVTEAFMQMRKFDISKLYEAL